MGTGTNGSVLNQSRYHSNGGGFNNKTIGEQNKSNKTQNCSSSSLKPTYKKIGNSSLKKIKFHSKSCEDYSKQASVYHKLDPKNPQHARKIEQRQKTIDKGKNTIGYDIYSRTVKKEKRRKFSMITPSTPDHTVDIPNKKWLGMIRSWRVALHRYDPVDLQQSFAATTGENDHQKKTTTQSPNNTTPVSVKEKELTDSGVLDLVQVTPNEDYTKTLNILQQSKYNSTACSMDTTPNRACTNNGPQLDDEQEDLDDVSFYSVDDDDSDDDLL